MIFLENKKIKSPEMLSTSMVILVPIFLKHSFWIIYFQFLFILIHVLPNVEFSPFIFIFIIILALHLPTKLVLQEFSSYIKFYKHRSNWLFLKVQILKQK